MDPQKDTLKVNHIQFRTIVKWLMVGSGSVVLSTQQSKDITQELKSRRLVESSCPVELVLTPDSGRLTGVQWAGANPGWHEDGHERLHLRAQGSAQRHRHRQPEQSQPHSWWTEQEVTERGEGKGCQGLTSKARGAVVLGQSAKGRGWLLIGRGKKEDNGGNDNINISDERIE